MQRVSVLTYFILIGCTNTAAKLGRLSRPRISDMNNNHYFLAITQVNVR